MSVIRDLRGNRIKMRIKEKFVALMKQKSTSIKMMTKEKCNSSWPRAHCKTSSVKHCSFVMTWTCHWNGHLLMLTEAAWWMQSCTGVSSRMHQNSLDDTSPFSRTMFQNVQPKQPQLFSESRGGISVTIHWAALWSCWWPETPHKFGRANQLKTSGSRLLQRTFYEISNLMIFLDSICIC